MYTLLALLNVASPTSSTFKCTFKVESMERREEARARARTSGRGAVQDVKNAKCSPHSTRDRCKCPGATSSRPRTHKDERW